MILRASFAAALFLISPTAIAQDNSASDNSETGIETLLAPSCSDIAFRAFDFWIGRWTVTPNGGDQPIAMNVIESVAEGCVIRETYTPVTGPMGVSMTTLEPDTGIWHQQWVGGVPGRIHFQGGPVGEFGDTMVLTGFWGTDDDGRPRLIRMTYTYREDGTVRQHGEASTDQGATWSDAFDFIYAPFPPE